MSVAIRFSRQGKKRSPFYRIVAADKRCARDGRFIELLGTYHPTTKVLKLDDLRYDTWLKVGAQPSDRVAKFLAQAEMMKPRERREQPKKSAPRAKTQERMKAAAAAEAAPAPAPAAAEPEKTEAAAT